MKALNPRPCTGCHKHLNMLQTSFSSWRITSQQPEARDGDEDGDEDADHAFQELQSRRRQSAQENVDGSHRFANLRPWITVTFGAIQNPRSLGMNRSSTHSMWYIISCHYSAKAERPLH
ncbi:hypothetical protein DPSP01_013078 [Paraphaeosphaeria sporulosa]